MELLIILSLIVMVSGTFNFNTDYGAFGVRGTVEGPAVIRHHVYRGNSVINGGPYPGHAGFMRPSMGTVRYINKEPGGNHGQYAYRGPVLPIPVGSPQITPNNFIRHGKPGGMKQSFDITRSEYTRHHEKAIPVGDVRQGFIGSPKPVKNTLHGIITGFPRGKNFAPSSHMNPVKFQSGNDFSQSNAGPFHPVGFQTFQPVGNMAGVPHKAPEFDGKHPGEIYRPPAIQGHVDGPHNVVGPGSVSGLPTDNIAMAPVRLSGWEYSGGVWGDKPNIMPGNTWGGKPNILPGNTWGGKPNILPGNVWEGKSNIPPGTTWGGKPNIPPGTTWEGKTNIPPGNMWGGGSRISGVRRNIVLHPSQLPNMFVDRLRTY